MLQLLQARPCIGMITSILSAAGGWLSLTTINSIIILLGSIVGLAIGIVTLVLKVRELRSKRR